MDFLTEMVYFYESENKINQFVSNQLCKFLLVSPKFVRFFTDKTEFLKTSINQFNNQFNNELKSEYFDVSKNNLIEKYRKKLLFCFEDPEFYHAIMMANAKKEYLLYRSEINSK